MTKKTSIFNDVVGPVMRGPSSSHTAASWRIARVSLDLLDGRLKSAVIEFDKNGAWATNYREQGTAMGVEAGLLGLEMSDDRMKDTGSVAEKKGVKIDYKVSNFNTQHPNTIRLTLTDDTNSQVQIVGISLGGGSFEIQNLNGFDLSIDGRSFELIAFVNDRNAIDEISELHKELATGRIVIKGKEYLMNFKSGQPFDVSNLNSLKNIAGVKKVILISPVMPIVAGNETDLPFLDLESLLEYGEKKSLDAGLLGIVCEQALSGLSESELLSKMENLIKIMEGSIKTGLNGTSWSDRILPQQSHLIQQAEKKGNILKDSLINQIIANVTAIMEAKSAMEVIVANPTAGSCGTVAGSLKAVAEKSEATQDDKIKAYFAAGIVGAYFAAGPGFAAEEHGCQVECGASAGMAAAGIVQLLGGTPKQALDAASMAIQNMIGLICDPVADRVEVPCLGKNISAAVNAYASATMVLAGFDAIIPFDQVLRTVSRVSAMMPACHKCSGTGGLAITETALNLKKKLG